MTMLVEFYLCGYSRPRPILEAKDRSVDGIVENQCSIEVEV